MARSASREIAYGVQPRAVAASARSRAWRKNLIGYAFIGPWVFAFLAFTAIPFLASAFLAFTTYNGLVQTISLILGRHPRLCA